ncbi:rod shape-determining protein MreC [Candidatus Falkowbacteria bacterium RBG_13_39_14]|uniref:Cell shape-determining protein MreC n=1 Tax=Candidatus Falkowbacteria bacterium RBG_13_39_14 TaxID=1797985 RepID=A0A1F5S9L2_9BACT|nr:MAG: rod shape-determining protein MreC [Candidatus Falkowbacteria bacterium RBG_13_39_14]
MDLAKKNKVLIAGTIIVLAVILHNFGILAPLENGAHFIFAPIQKFFYSISAKLRNSYENSNADKEEKEDLMRENFYLKEQIEKIKIENINLKILENENKELKDMLGFISGKELEYLAAYVIGKGRDSGSSLIIDKGERAGIRNGLAVISEKGLFIGKTFNCNEAHCHVLLLNDNQSRIAASIIGHKEAVGAVEGEYGLSMKMNLIPQHIEISAGDIIITSGLEGDIPYGLIIGEVNKVDKSEGELFQNANIQPLFPLDCAHIVSVILESS